MYLYTDTIILILGSWRVRGGGRMARGPSEHHISCSRLGRTEKGGLGALTSSSKCMNCAELFEHLHPDCEIVTAFDNSMTHHKKVDDALDASVLHL